LIIFSLELHQKAGRSVLLALVFLVPIVISPSTFFLSDIKNEIIRYGTLAILASLAVGMASRQKFRLPYYPILISSILVCGFRFYSSFYNEYVDWVVFLDGCISILLFNCVLLLLRDRHDINNLFRVWVVSSVFVCTYYLVQRLGLDPIQVIDDNQDKLGSFFGNRNFMAYFLLCLFPNSLYLMHQTKDSSKFVWMLCSGMILFTLIASGSRSAQLFLILSVPLYVGYFLYSSSKLRDKRTTHIVFVGLLLVYAVAGAYFFHRLLGMSVPALDELSHWRIGIWNDAIKMVFEKPWIGFGEGSFRPNYPAFRTNELGSVLYFSDPIFHSHNVYLELLIEGGVLGFLLFGALLLTGSGVMSVDRRLYQSRKNLAFFSAMSLFGCSFFAITGEISNVLFCTFFSWISLAVFYNSISGREHVIIYSRCKHFVFFSFAVVILLFFLGATFFYGARLASNIQFKKGTDIINNNKAPLEAKKHFVKALEHQPENIGAMYQLALLEMQDRKYQKALHYFAEIQKFNPYFEAVHVNKGVAYFRLGEYKKAIQNFLVFARIYPTFKESAFFLALAYYKNGDYEASLEWCTKSEKNGVDQRKTTQLRKAISVRQAAKE